jgi:hypothetical protein
LAQCSVCLDRLASKESRQRKGRNVGGGDEDHAEARLLRHAVEFTVEERKYGNPEEKAYDRREGGSILPDELSPGPRLI